MARILVVDDDPDSVFLLELWLKDAGYGVVSATDGEEAIQKAHRERPDLIILDILMPRLDGAEVGMRLTEDPATREIPIIFLTALKAPDEEVQPYGAPSHAVVAKSENPKELLSVIQNTLKKKVG